MVGVSGGVEGEPQSSLTVIAKSPRKQFLNILCIIRRSKDGFISTQLSILRGYETATRFMDCRSFSVQLSRFFSAFCGYYTTNFAFMFVTGVTHFYIVFKTPSFDSNRLSRRSSTMCLDGFYRYHCWFCQQWLCVTR